MRTVIYLMLLAILSSCGDAVPEASGIYICSSGNFVEHQEPELFRVANGQYDPEDSPDDIAAACFKEGQRVGIAALACGIVEVFDHDIGGGEYTLLYTDESGDTTEISIRDGLLIRDEETEGIYSLRDLAKFPALDDAYLCPMRFLTE